MKLTYAKSGVDIFRHKTAINSLLKKAKFRRRGFGSPLNIEGHYAGLVDFGKYALALCTDGVGSKIMIAEQLKKYDTLGIDCIAMNVNDCISIGAEPIAFVDYLALQKPNEKLTEEIGIGLNEGCKLANISLIGGETAILPEMINGFDLAGTCLGFVEKEKIITGKNIKEGDLILGLKSNGIHSNGYTLVRKVIEKNKISYFENFGGVYEKILGEKSKEKNKTIGEVLLAPTKIYVKEILKVLKNFEVNGLAHITGSGLRKLKRLNSKVKYVFDNIFELQDEFKLIQKLGNIENKEMYQTFNMGMGFCIIAKEKYVDGILKLAKGRVVGRIEKGEGVEIRKLKIYYG